MLAVSRGALLEVVYNGKQWDTVHGWDGPAGIASET